MSTHPTLWPEGLRIPENYAFSLWEPWDRMTSNTMRVRPSNVISAAQESYPTLRHYILEGCCLGNSFRDNGSSVYWRFLRLMATTRTESYQFSRKAGEKC